jgi:para-aminobenzoate synthetase/4-amino-4-deoxychorismate lyase
MIVDMVRNDLGRVADIGSVEVPELFTVERYPTVWQMTSEVRARSRAPLADLFAALHPSASVTGAPKVRTMEILADLEAAPRGVYTGAVGFVQPDGTAQFNVAIRTAVVEQASGRVSFGVGSGIVWDSSADAEYEECLLKGAVLGRRPPSFELLETLRWRADEGYFLCDRHVARILASADYFGFPLERTALHAALDRAAAPLRDAAGAPRRDRTGSTDERILEGIGAARCWRVRLLVARDGTVRTESYPVVPSGDSLRATVASAPVDESDVFLYHKTTHRQVYETARVEGFDEVVLWNRRGEITEGITTNVVAEIDGRRVTPPVECGLLAGTFRDELLARGTILEERMTKDDLGRATHVWLINSVYEWRSAELSW